MLLKLALICVALLFALGVLGMAFGRSKRGSDIFYSATLVVTASGAIGAVYFLLFEAGVRQSQVLPLGLPWLGAHFKLDSLSAFFLIVVNLGAAAASLFAIGYGRHEGAPERVLPFYSAFLAAMNLVVLADDAFSFLVSWEFMSLTSWALVMAHHQERDNVRAG
jgi:formate hydrogenlyase subunit 3/multisubunit Na+/H+ antiporter MnhD subunit